MVFTILAPRCCIDKHKHLHHLKVWSPVSVVCSTDVCRFSTHAAISPEKDPSHPQDVCTISTWIQVWPHNEPKENSKGQPTNQIVPVDQTLASPCSAVSSHAGATALLFLPCITAITQQQAILAVTSATNLTEGWIIFSIITLSFCVLNRNLNKRGVHILCRTWHFVKSIVTLTVPAAKPKSE